MARFITILIGLMIYEGALYSQTYNLKGDVADTANNPVSFSTISLLHPADSTLAYFGISNEDGIFDIKDVSKGPYLMQVAYLGFKTYYRQMEVPASNNYYLGRIVLKRLSNQLSEVEIKGEKIPVVIKRDTVEYNASSFKTRPDANTEELLKKLPGVQVDKAGNIKAQGEDVQNVLVDGKPFFSNDPKVATKNLPADAINKVQVFNKHSDASEFTGIDDGSREKTINLQLKDNKKNGYFGDVHAGYGTNNRYKAGAKIYKFKPKTQLAALAMLNNINQFGFTFQDYLNFNGGIGSLMKGGGFMNLGGKNAPPVDFGQPVYGLITSGAAGLNYTYEPKRNNRFNISYLGNGSDKKLVENSDVQNFTENNTFLTTGNKDEHSRNFMHRININTRKDKDSISQVTVNASVALSNGNTGTQNYTTSLLKDMVINNLDSRITDKGQMMSVNANLSGLLNSSNKKQVYKASASLDYNKDLTSAEWNNITQLVAANTIITDASKQNDHTNTLQYNGTISVLRSIGKGYFIEPALTAGTDIQHFSRVQMLTTPGDIKIDSLSPDFIRTYTTLNPGISLRKSSRKIQFNVGIRGEAGYLNRSFNSLDTGNTAFMYILPSLNWQNEYSSGKRIGFYYRSDTKAPDAMQLLPVVNYTNPLQLYKGNNDLRPEYSHRIGINWLWFDQFSFSSIFANLNAGYTSDKITWARTINSDLTQILQPVNVASDYETRGRIEYSRPVRKIGITLNTSFEETYNRGINLINNSNNIVNTFNHKLDISLGNRKKEKWDVNIGGTISITDSRYSVNQNFNSMFQSITGYGEISYRQGEHWYFVVSADITQYNAKSFNNAVLIPLVKSELSWYFLKSNRGTVTAEAFDLLNKNTGLQRVSQLNYLSETKSNIIGRYFMLSFKYRINKTGGKAPGNMEIKIK